MIPIDLPTTTTPVTTDGWYAHVDGTFGHYVGAARAGGPTCTQYAATASDAVHRDERGQVYAEGWPTRLGQAAP